MITVSIPLIIVAYILVNLAVFLMYVWDKHKSKTDKWRTPESTLLLAALLGPWGAVLGMQLVRHKTRKLKFKLVYVFLILHIILIVWYYT